MSWNNIIPAHMLGDEAPTRTWSAYQQAVFEHINGSADHLVVHALAGSGKTTTLLEALNLTEGRAIFTAFNRDIANELRARAPDDVKVSTVHGYGMSALRGRTIASDGYLFGWLRDRLGSGRETLGFRMSILKLASVAKNTQLTAAPPLDTLDYLLARYRIEVQHPNLDSRAGADDESYLRARRAICKEALAALEYSATQRQLVDFDDMCWLPVVLNLKPAKYDWFFVDETQDLNPVQIALVSRGVGKTGQLVAVGDEHQSIYQFRGADSQAMPSLVKRFDATVLPLSICYRCPSQVVAEAQFLVPELEAAPNAPDGTVRTVRRDALLAEAQPGDFVISRTNAPIVALCFKWLKEGRRATIRGREIGKGMQSFVKSSKATTPTELEFAINLWERREVTAAELKGVSAEPVIDHAECLRVVTSGADSIDEVLRRIDRLFSPDHGAVQLMSTHKAKGLEADRVWLLRDTYCKWEGPEEKNLLYVAITRSKRELNYVQGEE